MIHDRVAEETRALESAVYGALDACDAYLGTVGALLDAEEAKDDPNEMVVKRLRQFRGKASAIVRILEDDALTEMLFLVDRLHALEAAEEGTFI
jgi:hypothetical protein